MFHSCRKPHLQGRFSGRLETKHDEKKLQEECRQLGPLVGGLGKRGEKSRMTLAKIVRAIASGDVRKHCVERENKIQVRNTWRKRFVWFFSLFNWLFIFGLLVGIELMLIMLVRRLVVNASLCQNGLA